LAFLAGSGFAFGGLPTGATLRIFSKSFSVYRASCENGLHPARRSRFFTVAGGSLSLPAISETVIPFMPYIIGISVVFLNIVYYWRQLLNICVVNIEKYFENVFKKRFFLLTNGLFMKAIIV
jgi:hypothetical protein